MSGKPGMHHGMAVLEPCGTMAAVRRHYRKDGKGWQCEPCRQAERWYSQDYRSPARAAARAAERVNAPEEA